MVISFKYAHTRPDSNGQIWTDSLHRKLTKSSKQVSGS